MQTLQKLKSLLNEDLTNLEAAELVNDAFVALTDYDGAGHDNLSERLFLGLILETGSRGMALTIENLAIVSRGFKSFIESERRKNLKAFEESGQIMTLIKPNHTMTVINQIDDFLQAASDNSAVHFE